MHLRCTLIPNVIHSFNSFTGLLEYHLDDACYHDQSEDEMCLEQERAIIQKLTANNRATVAREARERSEQSVLAGIAVSALTWFVAIRFKRERKVERKKIAITAKFLWLCGIIVAVCGTALVFPQIRQLGACDWTKGKQVLSGIRTMGELQEKCGNPEVSHQVTFAPLYGSRDRLTFYFLKKGLTVEVDLIPDKGSAWYLDSNGVKLCKVDASTAFDNAFFSNPNPPKGVEVLPLAPYLMDWTGWPVTVQPQSYEKFYFDNALTLGKVQPC